MKVEDLITPHCGNDDSHDASMRAFGWDSENGQFVGMVVCLNCTFIGWSALSVDQQLQKLFGGAVLLEKPPKKEVPEGGYL